MHKLEIVKTNDIVKNNKSGNNFNMVFGEFNLTDIDEYYKILIQSSGKLVLLDKLLNKLKDGHNVLIFSQRT